MLSLTLFVLAIATPGIAADPAPEPLVAELGCAACHVELGSVAELREKTPDLGDAGSRYRAAYLYDYLRSPRQVRRHLGAARMPGFHLSDDEALALALFLAMQHDLPPVALPENLEREMATKEILPETELRALLIERECLTCHPYQGAGGSLGPPLDDVGARLEPGWMKRFLAAPHAYGIPDGVMPALFMHTNESGALSELRPGAAREIGEIVESLERTAAPERDRLERSYGEARQQHPAITPEMGRRIFVALNCAGCHRHREISPWDDAAPDLRLEASRSEEKWIRGYLSRPYAIRPFGGRAGSGSRMPDFRLTEDEAARIAKLLASPAPAAKEALSEPAKLSAYEKSKARLLLDTRLACLGCHTLGRAGGRIGPDLTGVASRRRPELVARMIADPSSEAPHSIMPKLPLDEATRDLLVGYLLGAPEVAPPPAYLSLTENVTIDAGPEGTPAHDYRSYCAPCHGADGQGDGFNAAFLSTPPTRHADAAHMSTRPDDTLFDGVHSGGAILGRSHLMPAFGESLSPERIAGLVAYMRELCQCDAPGWSIADGTRNGS